MHVDCIGRNFKVQYELVGKITCAILKNTNNYGLKNYRRPQF